MAQADRVLVREFDSWLRGQATIAAPTPGEESALFGELLKVAASQRMDLRSPIGVVALVELFGDLDESEQDGATGAAIATLHDYVHFRMETEVDPAGWEDAHDLVEEAAEDLLNDSLPGAEILAAAAAEADLIDPAERRAAFAATRVVAAVNELLKWIGVGRKVAPSGGARRADIAAVAKLLGISAVGVAKLPQFAPDSLPLIAVDEAHAQPGTLHVRSMLELPLLSAWWEALSAVEIIELGTYRVTPGPAAQQWTAEPLPPLDAAEMVIALTVAQFVHRDLTASTAHFGAEAGLIALSQLIDALSPEESEPQEELSEWEMTLDRRVRRDLAPLERVGVLTVNDRGQHVVPLALRGAVSGGLAGAMTLLLDGDEPD